MVLHRLTLVVGVLMALMGRVDASEGVIEFTTFQDEKNAAIASLPCKWVSVHGNDASQNYDFLCKGGNWATVSLMLDEADLTGDGVARVRLLFREWPAEVHPGGGEAYVAQQFLKHVAEHFVPASLAPEIMEAFWNTRSRVWNTRGLKIGYSIEPQGQYVLRRLEIRGMASSLKAKDTRRENEDVRGFAGEEGGLKSVGDVDLRTVSATQLGGVGRNPVVEEGHWTLAPDAPQVMTTGKNAAVGAPFGNNRDTVVPTTIKLLGESDGEREVTPDGVAAVPAAEQQPAPVAAEASPTGVMAPVVGGIKGFLKDVGAAVDEMVSEPSATTPAPVMPVVQPNPVPASTYIKTPAVTEPTPAPVVKTTEPAVPQPASAEELNTAPEPESLIKESPPPVQVAPQLTPVPAGVDGRPKAPTNFDAYNKATELTKDVEQKAQTMAKPAAKVTPAVAPLPTTGTGDAAGPALAPVPMPSLTSDDGAMTEVPGVGLVPVSTVSKTIGLELVTSTVPAGNGEGLGTPSTPPQAATPIQDPLRPLPQLRFVPRAVPVQRPDEVIQFEDEKSQL